MKSRISQATRKLLRGLIAISATGNTYGNHIYLIRIKEKRIYLKKHNKPWWIWGSVAKTPVFCCCLIFFIYYSSPLSRISQAYLQTQFNFCIPHEVERMQGAKSEDLLSDPDSYLLCKVKKWANYLTLLHLSFPAVKQE